MGSYKKDYPEIKAAYERKVKEVKILLQLIAEDLDEKRPAMLTWGSIESVNNLKLYLRNILSNSRSTHYETVEETNKQIEALIKERL